MNKKNWIAICAVFVLIAVGIAVALVSRGCTNQQPSGIDISGTAAGQNEDGTAQTQSNEETTGGESGTVDTSGIEAADQGVGNLEDFDAQDTTGDGTDTPEATTQATQASKTQSSDATAPTAAAGSTKPELLTYEAFLALSATEQEKYFYAFSDPADYIQWLTEARLAYEETQTSIVATGDVDLGEVIVP